jgi:AbrB family looped-hinge helix DNA binding protein
MSPPQTKITAQGQISIPAEIRRSLGVGPGSVLEWEQDGERVVVRRAGRYDSAAIHQRLFPVPPRARTLAELKEALRAHGRGRRASR